MVAVWVIEGNIGEIIGKIIMVVTMGRDLVVIVPVELNEFELVERTGKGPESLALLMLVLMIMIEVVIDVILVIIAAIVADISESEYLS